MKLKLAACVWRRAWLHHVPPPLADGFIPFITGPAACHVVNDSEKYHFSTPTRAHRWNLPANGAEILHPLGWGDVWLWFYASLDVAHRTGP